MDCAEAASSGRVLSHRRDGLVPPPPGMVPFSVPLIPSKGWEYFSDREHPNP